MEKAFCFTFYDPATSNVTLYQKDLADAWYPTFLNKKKIALDEMSKYWTD